MWTIALATVLVALGADASPGAAATPSERTAQEVRAAAHAALREEATAQAADRDTALLKLAATYRELQQDQLLSRRERTELRETIRARLVRRAEALAKEIERDAKRAAEAGSIDVAQRAIHAQQQPAQPQQQPLQPAVPAVARRAGAAAGFVPPSAANGAAPQHNAQQLLDVIHATIAPGTWDVAGGKGHAVYFAPTQHLVILQTEDVHAQIRDLLDQLRR